MELMKAPDRIYTTIKVKDLTNAIDNAPYFGLERTSISRSELFLFAMALGSEAIPTKLDSINSGGLVLEKSIDSRTKALMYALYIEHMPQKNNLDSITNKGEVYNQAQEYANTGFEIIEGYMQQKKDQDLIWDLLVELDEQYEKEFPEE
jgi:hypothetical protein